MKLFVPPANILLQQSPRFARDEVARTLFSSYAHENEIAVART